MLVAISAVLVTRLGYRAASQGDRFVSLALIAAGGVSAAVILYQYSLAGSVIVLVGGVLDTRSSNADGLGTRTSQS
jgi:hypothetical protein